jgi:exodeoxyribonuclease VII large subunit
LTRRLERAKASVDALAGRLDALSPYKVLSRGYALIGGPDGKPLLDPDAAPAGSELVARLAGGLLKLRSEGRP